MDKRFVQVYMLHFSLYRVEETLHDKKLKHSSIIKTVLQNTVLEVSSTLSYLLQYSSKVNNFRNTNMLIELQSHIDTLAT